MICPKCHHALPDDSKFCQFCGELIEKANDPKQVNIPPSKAETMPPKKDRKKPAIIILAIALLLSVIANAAQLYDSSVRAEEIDGLNQEISAKGDEIDGLKQEISAKDEEISSLQAEYDNYSILCSFIKNETPGYGSSMFYVDQGVIVLDKNSSKEITLTNILGGKDTVSMSTSGNSAAVSFSDSYWQGYSGKLTVYGRSEGITTVTFSTKVDPVTFKVMVLVV